MALVWTADKKITEKISGVCHGTSVHEYFGFNQQVSWRQTNWLKSYTVDGICGEARHRTCKYANYLDCSHKGHSHLTTGRFVRVSTVAQQNHLWASGFQSVVLKLWQRKSTIVRTIQPALRKTVIAQSFGSLRLKDFAEAESSPKIARRYIQEEQIWSLRSHFSTA